MTDMTTTAHPHSTAASPRPSVAPVAAEPTLITEQQVRFGTAAAIAPGRLRTRRWTEVFSSFATAVRRAADPPAPVHRHPDVYLENALMAREMDRL